MSNKTYEDLLDNMAGGQQSRAYSRYHTMSAKQLQEILATSKDKDERKYVEALLENMVVQQREKDLKIMLQRGKPESVLYDPDFLEKSEYRSTKLTDGSRGESDTGYADIDYEFINGNPEISELIVGLDRNYRYISDYERQVYNYWHNYDREHGTNVADNFLNLLQETLNDRDSAENFAKVEGNLALEGMYGLQAGWSRWGNDVNNWILQPEGYIPTTSMEMTSGRIYNDMADVGTFLTIGDKSLGQLVYGGIEEVGYNLPGTLVSGLAGQSGPVAGGLANAIFSGTGASGEAYQELINQGFTPEEATKYGNLVGLSVGTSEAASSFLADILKMKTEGITSGPTKSFIDSSGGLTMSLLADVFQEETGLYSKSLAVGKNMLHKSNLFPQKYGPRLHNPVDTKSNLMYAAPGQSSLERQKALLERMRLPLISESTEKPDSFKPKRLEDLIFGLGTNQDTNKGIGTIDGDVVYGADGHTINRQMLQQWADQAVRQRGMYANDPMGKALYERYKNLR